MSIEKQPIIVPESSGGGPRTKEHQAIVEKLRKPVIGTKENAQRRKKVEERLEEIEKAHKGYIDDKEREVLEKELAELEGDNKKSKESQETESKEKAPALETKESDKEKAENLSDEIKESETFKEFNISIEELEKIPGFEKLSYGQRLLVAENLKQLSLGRVHEEAGEKYVEDVSRVGFLGRVWKGVSKKYQIAKLEKTTTKNILSGGMKIHGDILSHLIERAVDGPDVEVTKGGNLEILYASNMEGLTPEQEQSVENFNQTATKFSKMPKEWSHETASKKEQKEYKELREQYEKGKAGVLDIRRDKSGYKEAAVYVNDIDSRVYGDQFLNTHPEVEEQLQNITDKSIWARAMANVATERGLYFAGGFITRTLTTSILGLAGAPLAAAGMGGFIARKRAKEGLVEHEIEARRGVKDSSKEAKNFVDVENMRAKLEKLTERVSNEKDPVKREKLLVSLRARVSYTQGKMEDGLMNYGKGVDRFASQYELISSLSSAVVYTGAGRAGKNELELRLDDFLNFKEGKISKAQEKYVRDQTIRGAVMGAGFAVAGYALRHFGEEWFDWGKDVTPDLPKIEQTVSPGDNLWNIIEKKLDTQNLFEGMEEGQRTHLIDTFKDKFTSMSPEELKAIGIVSGDANILHAGETIDMSSVLGDTQALPQAIYAAETLTDAQIVSIEANNVKIADWAEAHPDTAITAEKIDTILGHGGHAEVNNAGVASLADSGSEIAGADIKSPEMLITPEEVAGRVDKVMQNKIESIYEHKFLFFKGSQIEEWNGNPAKGIVGVKDMKVDDILKGEFGSPFGNRLDTAESDNQKQLLDFLYELRGDAEPLAGETTGEYVKRALEYRISTTGEGLKPIDLNNIDINSEISSKNISSNEAPPSIVAESKSPEVPEIETSGKITPENIPSSGLSKKIIIENIDVQKGNINIEGSLQGYRGTEVLSTDYIKKLNTSGDFSISKTEANSVSRDLSLHLAAYDQLKSEGLEEKAEVLLKSIHEKVLLHDKSLGKGVIDYSKIPGLEGSQ